MSISSLDWSQISGRFGNSGKTTVEKMVGLLEASSFSVTYHSDNGKFSIQGSSKVDKAAINIILWKGVNYKVWAPQVLDETDSLGNRLVLLTRTEYKGDVIRHPDSTAHYLHATSAVNPFETSNNCPTCKWERSGTLVINSTNKSLYWPFG